MPNIRSPELQGAAIVAIGAFNPAIFQPHWFALNQLIRREEADSAEVRIVSREASIFSTDWFELKVIDRRFAIDTKDPTMFRVLRDLAIQTFRILEHTPVDAFGFNTERHFRMDTDEEWNAFGDYYVPKQTWNALLTRPGMRSLVIEGSRPECNENRMQIKLEPSLEIHPGIAFYVNQHYGLDAKNTGVPDRLHRFVTALCESWDNFLEYSDRVSQHLLTECATRAE